jgi:hypothetical protein
VIALQDQVSESLEPEADVGIFTNTLVADDCSEQSRLALDTAAKIAQSFHSKLTIPFLY